MTTLVYRALGAAVLDPSTYEDVEGDRAATWQALVVVILSSVAAGVGAAGHDGPDPIVILAFSALALVTWLAWAAIIQQIGGRLFPEQQTRVDFGELVRTIGFAAAPGGLQVMGLLTSARTYVFAVAWIWMLAAMVVAVRQALDYRSLWHAAGICIIALVVVTSTALAISLALGLSVS